MTPMIRQYLDIKKNYPDDIVFFRMGDFYEMFFEDAKKASKILDIALTARQNDVPMCGIPFHAADNYIGRIIKTGLRVAICEQLETVPSQGTIVKRDVVRIVTPGTIIESHLLQSDDNNFLASIIIDKNEIGLSFVDISTGDFYLSTIDKSLEIFRGEITKFDPKEVVFFEGKSANNDIYSEFIKSKNIPIYKLNEWLFDKDYMETTICETFKVKNTKGLGIQTDLEIITSGAILQYLKETHKKAIDHLKNPHKVISKMYMILDESTISNLELVENQQDKTKNRTLLSVLNFTKTPMGKRALERNILQPLLIEEEIENRLNIIQYFFEYHTLTTSLQEILKEILDIERLVTRFTIGKIQPRNFIALKNSLSASEKIKEILNNQPDDNFKNLAKRIPSLKNLNQRISSTIENEPALSPDQGRIIRKGYSSELDHLYELKTNAKNWILKYQEDEKRKVGSNTLKIKYNRVLGYYIEISKAQATNIPDDYMRKQTLVSSERFTTSKLQEFETDILSSSDKIIAIEKREIENLREDLLLRKVDLQELAKIIGEIDFYSSMATAAIENNFIRPTFNQNNVTHISEGRHPIVEKYYTKEIFIPNDINFDGDNNIIKLITGPNMAGKSTYIRMAAIIQLMAQVGSFVPASKADIVIADRIFTRVGASDNISRGESTFLVEMNETANILNNATNKSLIIMDEIGRGTSTYDGLSIAWAVVLYILRYIKARTLFATHYHELTELGSKKGIVNYNVLVKEQLHGVEFLHKVIQGAADKSYGIHVAKLAGIPTTIISQAERILQKLENDSKNSKSSKNIDVKIEENEQLDMFNASNHLVIQAIKSINLQEITPIDALNELNRLKKLIE